MITKINKPSDGLNGYKAFFGNREAEVYANTAYAALVLAQNHFKPSKSKRHLVHVRLCELAGIPVTLTVD
jgi:hypothetical protein